MGIQVLPPDVNISDATFIVESPAQRQDGSDSLRPAGHQKRGVGRGRVARECAQGGALRIALRFCVRIDTRLANKRVVESFAKAGALDSLYKGPPAQARPRLLEALDDALNAGSKMKADADFAQESLFGETEIKAMSKGPVRDIVSAAEWNLEEVLAAEKEVLGLYLSGHPLKRFEAEMGTYTTCTLARLPEGGTVRVAGHILSVRRMTTKKGNLMARFILEDLEGEAEITIFPKALTPEVNELLVSGSMVAVKGQVENRDQGGRKFCWKRS